MVIGHPAAPFSNGKCTDVVCALHRQDILADDLALIYPYPPPWPAGLVIGAGLLLAVGSGFFLWRVKRNPYLLIGWLWFLGTLARHRIGANRRAIHADRYTYIPSIGLFIVVIGGLNDLGKLWPKRQAYLALAGGIALVGCLMVTSIQINYWQDSVRLFSHTIAVTSGNYAANNCLGDALEKLGRKDEALQLYAKTVEIAPTFRRGNSIWE